MTTREAIVSEARSWLGTPYHHAARIKGVGVDCAMLVAEVLERAGLVPHIDPQGYPADWMQHRNEERFLAEVQTYALRELDLSTEQPAPGDVVLYRFGRCFAHGAIVVAWPLVIHAASRDRIVTLAEGNAGWLENCPVRAFSMFEGDQ
ncbi:NlpC/P60 family protein [Niveibacterium sp.]|uniref:NlpC/P60 family protein n=1 Tax=Niveibacterium sp. TaxID=2017444 RepID=UPI0035ADE741